MNFDSLGYFLALAREKNFTRAAETLHITQQSLSSHIANLERELNCTLVVRRTPLQLTYAGRTFLRTEHNARDGENHAHLRGPHIPALRRIHRADAAGHGARILRYL